MSRRWLLLVIPAAALGAFAGYVQGHWRGFGKGADWAADQQILDLAGKLPPDQVLIMREGDP